MAKTTSQIVEENKKKQEARAYTEKIRNGPRVQAKSTPTKAEAAQQKAEIAAAGERYKQYKTNKNLESAYREQTKTASDRLWDRQSTPRQKTEQDEAVSGIVKAKRNAEQKKKELEDYQNSDYDWTDAAARELYEKGEKQKKQEIARAQAEQNAAVANFDRVQMNAMSEEDRALIDEYIRREDTASDPLATGTDAIVEHFVNQNGAIDEERLKQLVSTRRRELNAQRMQETQEKAQKEVNDGWMSIGPWANLKTVPANLISGAMGTMSDIHDYFNRDERYSGLDPNSMGNQLNVYSSTVRGQTAQNIVGTEEARAAQIEKLVASGYGRSEAVFIVNKGRQGLAALYQGGMSLVDSGARIAAGGALGLGAGFGATVAGLNTFSQTMSDASARGATPEQALALAATTAGIEALTEKVPLDNLIQVSKGGGTKPLIKNILRQDGIEATEEMLSLIGDTLADAAIMQEKSEYNQTVAEYMAQGMTEEQAREQANLGLLQKAWETVAVAVISGTFGGLTSSAVAAYNQDGLDTTSQQAAQQPQAAQNPQDVNVDVQQEGAVQAAQEAQKPQTPQEQEQAILEETGKQLAENAPKPEPEVKTEGQKLMEQGVQKTLGTETAADTAKAESAQQVDTPEVSAQEGQTGNAGNGPVEAAQPAATANAEQTTGMQNAPSGEVKKSKSVTNTGLNNADEDIRRGYQETLSQDPTAGDYEVKRNKDTRATAQERTNSPERVRAEYDYLMGKTEMWTAEDVATARLASKELFKSGDADRTVQLNKKLASVAANSGQVSQAFSIDGTMKDAADSETAARTATERIMGMKEGESTFKAKDGKTYEQWQKETAANITRIGFEIDRVADGDTGAMRDVIRQIARSRKTTAWFGTSDRMTGAANRILNKLDFDTLKKIANTQLAAMPDDFKRRSKTEIVMGLRKQSMLTSFKTFSRNIIGNGVTGFMDSISDSAGGQFADVILSKITGKRTVGTDITKGKAYFNAAKDAMDFASLCVELNIPIETEVNASYAAASGDGGKGGKYVGKTFRSNGNFAMRALYGYQKYMSYALEVSDKIFEGGTNAAVAESLQNLKNSGLSYADIQELGEYTANRRTFKDATFESYNSKGGKVTRGSELSRMAQSVKKIGNGTALEPVANVATDIAMPFAPVPMNVAQTGIDYTVGTAKGITEMAAIIRDVKAGREISVARQRQAATDFGRGLTGVALIGLFTTAAAKGIIAVHNDKDKNKRALEQSEGLSGAQINWSAWERSMNGGSEEWKDGDTLSSLDFLEPFNTHLYLACELAKEDTMQDILKAYPKAAFFAVRDAFMDSPMVQGITDIADLISGLKDAENPEEIGNELAGYAGDVASSFVPQIVRQAAQVKDGYYRDTRGTNAAEYAKNNFLAAIPGASETLPKKVNGFGEEQERLGWVSTFFDPTNTQKYRKNDMTGYLEELSGKTGDMSIYPERQAPMKITVNKETIPLTGQQRETYQKTYGEKLDEYYRGLTESGDFDRMTDEQKVEALKQAKEYATQHAKAAVSDYQPEKKAYSSYFTTEVTAKTTVDSITDIFKDGAVDPDKLEAAYKQYSGMSTAAKKQVQENAEAETKAFLEVREKGASAKSYIAAVKRMDALRPQEGYDGIRDIQIREAIANAPGTDDKTIDIIMKAYMADYDPNARTKVTTELKYDYARQELGLSPQEYVETYNVQLDGGKKAEKIKKWMDMGYSREMANMLYRLYSATGKTKIDVVKWHEGK